MSDLTSYVFFVVGLALVLERIIEFMIVRMPAPSRFLGRWGANLTPADTKKLYAILLAVIIGPLLTAFMPNLLGLDASINLGVRIFMGAVAGALSPYAHSMVEILANFQQTTKIKPIELAKTSVTVSAEGLNPNSEGSGQQSVTVEETRIKGQTNGSSR